MTYWSRSVRTASGVYYDNQRPLQLPRLPFKDDALSVEASAYALLVYIAKEGLYQEYIVRWLNSMRGTFGGFISTQVLSLRNASKKKIAWTNFYKDIVIFYYTRTHY